MCAAPSLITFSVKKIQHFNSCIFQFCSLKNHHHISIKKRMHAWIRVTLKCTSIIDVHFSATPWILFQNGAVIIVIVAHLHIRFYLIIPNHLCDCLHTHHLFTTHSKTEALCEKIIFSKY